MGTSNDLLRMLEPAIRPVPTQAFGGAQDGPQTFENKTFDQLLGEARMIAGEAGEASGGQGAEEEVADSLSPLARIDLVENAGLRALLASHTDQSGQQQEQESRSA